MQVLGVVGPEEDEPAHVGVPLPLDILAAQVTQLTDNDVNQHVKIVGVEKFMAVIVLNENRKEDMTFSIAQHIDSGIVNGWIFTLA